MTKRVAVYARVSTARQAVNDVSIPDQLKQARDNCRKQGWEIVREYVERGASARDDKRHEFRTLIETACTKPSPYDIVLVHSLSRFYRDAIEQGFYRRKLEKHGVLLHSLTQDFGEGAQAELLQTIIAACDAHTSAETAKHVSRSMQENARQGFWNGSKPPIGYRTYVAEVRGEKQKKKLEIDPKGAEIVKLVYRLFMEGDGRTGPIGVKQIADYLNTRGYRTNTGGPFYIGTVHAILTRSVYSGVHYFNRRCSRTGKTRSREEWVPIETPVIIPPETFDAVQRRLKDRSPKKTAPRVVNSPVLLAGLARCHNCNGSLMLTTGKSGRYRYYSCASKTLRGSCGCGRPIRIPEAKLDTAVTDALIERLFTRDRLKALLAETLKKARDNNQETLHDLRGLRRELREADKKVERLYDALTDGTVTDTRGFRDHLSRLENQREELMRLISIKERRLNMDTRHLTNRQIDRFANGLRDLLKDGPKPFRKEYLRLLVSEVNVGDDEIRISGSKAALAAAVQTQKATQGQVPGYVREWRTRQDSNL